MAASQDDVDGDGVRNEDEVCVFGEASGVDQDRDGTDDACDAVIDEAPADTLPPLVVGTPDRSANAAGWHNSDVIINWLATDPEPSSGAPTQPLPTLAGTEGVSTYTSEQSCDPLNNCATGSLELKIDKTVPTINQAISPAPNTEGWYNTDVVVTPSCGDELSGVLECDPSVTLSTEGANQVVSSTALDRADNTQTVSTNFNIDKTPPLFGAPTWNNNPKSTMETALITIPTTDNLSGIVEAEYYLGDTDPGRGNGATMQVREGAISVGFNADFPTGVYKVTIRAKDKAGNWSADVSDYLVAYDPFGTRMTGKRTLLPSLSNGDRLTGLINFDQEDRAKFGFNIRYDKDGNIHRNSDLQFKYETGAKCNKPTQAINCHSFELNATSIAWLTTQDQNDSTGIFQGQAKLEVDGVVSDVRFRLAGLDGERLDASSQDHLTLKIYPADTDPNTATPFYRVSADVLRGNVKIHKWQQ